MTSTPRPLARCAWSGPSDGVVVLTLALPGAPQRHDGGAHRRLDGGGRASWPSTGRCAPSS